MLNLGIWSRRVVGKKELFVYGFCKGFPAIESASVTFSINATHHCKLGYLKLWENPHVQHISGTHKMRVSSTVIPVLYLSCPTYVSIPMCFIFQTNKVQVQLMECVGVIFSLEPKVTHSLRHRKNKMWELIWKEYGFLCSRFFSTDHLQGYSVVHKWNSLMSVVGGKHQPIQTVYKCVFWFMHKQKILILGLIIFFHLSCFRAKPLLSVVCQLLEGRDYVLSFLVATEPICHLHPL